MSARRGRDVSSLLRTELQGREFKRTLEWDRSLRWGGEQTYEFTQQTTPGTPFIPYFQSRLLAHLQPADASELPRVYAALMQCTFDGNSEWAGSAGTETVVQFSLFVGVGQTQIRLDKFVNVVPATGVVQPFGGVATTLTPFPTVQVQWEAIPAHEINAQIFISSTQFGSPGPFTGQVAAMLAPYYPLERR